MDIDTWNKYHMGTRYADTTCTPYMTESGIKYIAAKPMPSMMIILASHTP